MFDIIHIPLPHFSSRRGRPVKAIIVHCLGYTTVRRCLEGLYHGKVSAHYFVPQVSCLKLQEKAQLELSKTSSPKPFWHQVLVKFASYKPTFPHAVPVIRLVPDERRAWHAGVSHWGGRSNLNSETLGIEFQCSEYACDNNLYHFEEYSPSQAQTGIALIQNLVKAHKLDPYAVLAHSDIAWDRTPVPKTDPGPTFFWKELHQAGLGYLPPLSDASSLSLGSTDPILWVQKRLRHIGYRKCPLSGLLCSLTQRTLDAYRMHFLTEERHLISKGSPQPQDKQMTSLLIRSLSHTFPWEKPSA